MERRFTLGHLEGMEATPPSGERFVDLATIGGIRIEHILSSETPDQAEYCQDHDEWVLVLHGAATLRIEDEQIELRSGDWLLIPAGTRHRVLRTETGTQWIALHG